MSEFISKYLTSEAVLVGGGIVWAILAQFLPGLSALDVPAIGGFTPAFAITPGHMIALGLIPIAIKTVTPGKTPFVGVPTAPPAPATEDKKDA